MKKDITIMIKYFFKPQAPFESIRKNAKNPVICIMRSIIMQAILDYTAIKNNNPLLFYWFFINNKHFQYVCTEAKLTVHTVRHEIIKIIKHAYQKRIKYKTCNDILITRI